MLDDQDIMVPALEPGCVISNRYEIVRLLGSGAMGSVHLVYDRVLEGNTVAIKVMHPELARDRSLTKRFLREVQLMHQVNHPNVIRTYDVGCDGGLIYFTMEYVPGVTLAEASHSRNFSVEEIEDLLLQIAAGLDAIHQARILHRDLKPGNIILLDDGQIKIADFGVARPAASSLTQHREIMGSFEYMAPEIWQGRPLTESVDYYSLGVILYELATGVRPFDSSEPATMMWLHINTIPEAPLSVNPSVPAWMSNLIMNLLAKLPEGRPSSYQEIRSYIRNDAHALPISLAASSSGAGDAGLPAVRPPAGDVISPFTLPDDSDSFPLFSPSSESELDLDLIPTVDTSRSAVSGIIFRNTPTAEDIIHHENIVASGTRSRLQSNLEEMLERKRLRFAIQLLFFALCCTSIGLIVIASQGVGDERGSAAGRRNNSFLAQLGRGLQSILPEPSSGGGYFGSTSRGNQPLFQPLIILRDSLSDYSEAGGNASQFETQQGTATMKERLLGRPQAENRQLTMYEFLFGVDEPDAVPPPELLLNSDSPAQSYRLREFGEQRIEPVPAVDLEALTGDLAARLELNSSATLPDRKTAESLKKTLADRNLRVIAAEKDKLANTIDRLQMQLQLAILSDDLRRKRLKKIESRLHSLGDLESRIEAEYLSQEKYFKLWQTVQAAAGSRDLLQLAHYLSPLDEQVKTAASQYHEASANYSLALEGFFTDSAREAQRHLGRQLQQMRISLKKEINRLISENINRHHENMVRLITLTDSARRSSMQLAEQRTAIEEYEKALRHGQPALHESQKELSAALEAAKVRLQDLRNVLPDEKEQLLRSYHVMQALGLENST